MGDRIRVESATSQRDALFAIAHKCAALHRGGRRPTARTGHWSVDRSGRLVSDLAGTSGATEAWVTADHLTILLGDQSVTRQRS
jgi:hypothetical protein